MMFSGGTLPGYCARSRRQIRRPAPGLRCACAYPREPLRCAAAQHALGVHAAAPEGDIFAELALQLGRVHAGGADLHRIENIHADLNQVADNRADRAAGVEEDLGFGAGMDEIEQLLVQRLDDPAVHGWRDQHAELTGKIICLADRVHIVAHFAQRDLPISHLQLHHLGIRADQQISLLAKSEK